MVSESASARRRGLLSDPDFLRLWTGQTVSVFGSLISRTAIPFMAALTLHATPAQVALLAGADMAPGLFVGLFAGAWADRARRRPLMIAADIGRALLLALIPLLAWRGVLRIEYLYAISLLTGVLNMLFDVAYGAYLPTLVGPERIEEGNAKLSASASAAEVGAFGLSGWLVQWFGSPWAVGIDALSFLVSAITLTAIRRPESAPTGEARAEDTPVPSRQRLRAEIVEGMHVVAHDQRLRVLAIVNTLLSFSFRMVGTLMILFITRTLGVPTGIQGMIFAIGGVTSLLGALAIGPLTRRFGFGRVLTASLVSACLGAFSVPLAPDARPLGLALLALSQIVTDPSFTIFEIHQTSLRQAITPNEVRGRVEATFRFLGVGASLLGVTAAGILGERLGLRTTMLLGVGGACLACAPLIASPIRTLRVIPSADPISCSTDTE